MAIQALEEEGPKQAFQLCGAACSKTLTEEVLSNELHAADASKQQHRG